MRVQSVRRLDDLLGLVRGVDGRHRPLVEVEVLGVHDDVDVGHVAELAQLQRGELDLGRAPAGEHVHVGDRRGREDLVDVGRDLGRQQVVGVLGEDAGDVERDVAGAEHGDLAGLERPGARDVGVAVVPGDEVGRAVGPGQVDAGDVEVGVADGAGGEDHGVVELAQVVELEVDPVVPTLASRRMSPRSSTLRSATMICLMPGVVGRHAVAGPGRRARAAARRGRC